MLVKKDCIYCDARSISCFDKLASKDLANLNIVKTSNVYKKGQTMFYEGQQPNGIYCLNEGKIKIYKTGVDGKEQIVRFVTPGGFLGLRALISGREYSASATTLEDSIVCFIDKRSFLKLTLKYPYLSHALMIELSHLLEEAENKLTSLAQKGVRERLAETLLVLDSVFRRDNHINKQPVINLSRGDLANIVGTATETVIRLLSEFREEKMISLVGRKILLKDMDGLKRVAKLSR